MFYVWCLFIPGFKSLHGLITLYLAVNEMEHDFVLLTYFWVFWELNALETGTKLQKGVARENNVESFVFMSFDYFWTILAVRTVTSPHPFQCQQQMNDTPLHAMSIYFYYSFFLVFFFVFVFVFIFRLCVFVCRFAACSFIHRCQCRCHHPIARLIQLRRWLLTAFVRHKLGLTS